MWSAEGNFLSADVNVFYMKFFKFFSCALLLSGVTLSEAQERRTYSQVHEWRSDYQEDLPEWLFGCQDSFFWGVSDPYLVPDVAREQALQRALFLYALREGVEVRMLQDYFLVTETDYGIDKQSNKLMLLFSLNFKVEGVVYEVLHQHNSRYGEVYVAITVRKDTSGTGCLSGVSEFMQVVKENDKFDTGYRILLNMKASMFDVVDSTFFLNSGNVDVCRIVSRINDEFLYFPKDCYRYRGHPPGEDQEKGRCMQNSFWCAQLESLLFVLSEHVFDAINVKNTGEVYGSQIKELKREVVKDCVRVFMDGCYVRDNRLGIDWRVVGSFN